MQNKHSSTLSAFSKILTTFYYLEVDYLGSLLTGLANKKQPALKHGNSHEFLMESLILFVGGREEASQITPQN